MRYPDSIVSSNLEVCFLCGRRADDIHHVFNGPNRKNSTKYGLVVGLCRDCHTSPQGVHFNRDRNDWLKREGQRAFETKYSHEEFMRIFGKNYL